MNNLQMVDLHSQYQRIKPEIDNALQQVLNSTAFINGPEVKSFANNLQKYLEVKHVIPCANGTDALQIAFMALGLRPGDEVITVPFTFIATVEAIALLGLKVVYVDVDPSHFTMDVSKLEAAITPKTKAIVPVHLYGQCANMKEIMAIAQKHNLYVIEDTAQALGATYFFAEGSAKKAGTIGDLGCTSFFPSKNLGCYGDGGAMYTNNDVLAEQIRMIVNHGSKVKYYHETIGVNSRLDTIQAAILNVKLNYLDEYNNARKKAAAFYDKAFENCDYLQTPQRVGYSDHIFHQYTLKITGKNRDFLKDKLAEKKIPSMVYYPVSLHVQKAYAHLGYKPGDMPVSEKLTEQVLSLPIHTEMENNQLEYIAENVLQILKQIN
jgi:UDP-2-acetamido-2-deoxy-ribo-hexuluronate aminotransferase